MDRKPPTVIASRSFLAWAQSSPGANGYTGAGLNYPYGIAIDGSGNVWVTNELGNSVTELGNTGTILSGASGYTGGGLGVPAGIAIDGSGNAWVANYLGSDVTELSSSGAILSGAFGYTGGGIHKPTGIAIDGSGDVWVTDTGYSSVTELVGVATPVITPIAAGLPSAPTANGSSTLGTRP
jgi:streptogramin lyase